MPATSTAQSPTRILDLNEVRTRIPLSRTQIWRLERTGEFPGRIRLGPNRVGWREDEISSWIESRPAVSDGEPHAND